ncbi:unnamed protein product [Larinioides sclopetarius]|uniref:Uncharacterized protein n=1 Tax=Larinioides sclopetarius TaxID=280406 RepID=A0AAV1ZUM8_9ARAC
MAKKHHKWLNLMVEKQVKLGVPPAGILHQKR